jgi:hypothetical protein
MAALKNARHEAFARLVVRGESATAAYSSVYGVTGRTAEVSAHRLMRKDVVADRINELQGAAAQRTTKTLENLVAELDEAAAFARQCGNPTALVSAINSQARLLGFWVDRSQVEVHHGPAPLSTKLLELSEDEWKRKFSPSYAQTPALPSAKKLKPEKRKPPPTIEWDASTGEILKARTITIGDDDDCD